MANLLILILVIPWTKKQSIEISRQLISDAEFCSRHRQAETDFTRNRRLPFPVVLTLGLRKGVKSLQNIANEAMTELDLTSVSASAFSQARYKIKHTAFIELNQKAVVDTLYNDNQYKTYWGFRLLAVDGSKVVLPDTPDIRKAFGTIAWSKGKDSDVSGDRPYALASVLYDVLNRVALDATLGHANAYEVDMAVDHLAYTRPDDLLIMDRNYPSYRMLTEMVQRQRHFVIRCSAASFSIARKMLKGEGPDSKIVTLTPCSGQVSAIRERNLPLSLKVRFIRVLLSTGEYEVLVTSLLDEDKYPTQGFHKLYRWRWGIETYYGVIKTRLELENFSGIGVEAVMQDFFSMIYLSGLESIFTESAQAQMNAKKTKHRQIVNRAVSYNALKNNALRLLLGGLELEPLFKKLTALFLSNPCLERKNRNPPRKRTSSRTLLDHHKRRLKHCY